MMTKPVLKDSFLVEDIHKLREYHYKKTKNFSKNERIKEVNDSADRVKKDIAKLKKDKIAI